MQIALDVTNVKKAKLLMMAPVNRAQMEKVPILIKQFVYQVLNSFNLAQFIL